MQVREIAKKRKSYMKDILNSAKYTRMKTDAFTGEPRRQWLEYADGVFESVRKEGSLSKKYHGNPRTLDWWTVDKPAGWNPLDEGKSGAKTTLAQGAAAFHANEARRKATGTPKTRASAKNESLAYKYLVPPLWKPRGNPGRDWAERVLKNKLEGFGEIMKHGGPWQQGVIEELGDGDPELLDIPRGKMKSLWPFEE